MEVAIVIPAVLAGNACVIVVMVNFYVADTVAILVIAHKGVHVCVVVSVIYGSVAPVMAREVIPVPRRQPRSVMCYAQVGEYKGPCNEYRLNDVLWTKDVRVSNNLDMGRSHGRDFGDY